MPCSEGTQNPLNVNGLTFDEQFESILTEHKKLITYQINKLHLRNDEYAMSYGIEALYNAMCTFTPGKGASFPTYATVCIYNKLAARIKEKKRLKNTRVVLYEDLKTTNDDNVVSSIIETYASDTDIERDYSAKVGVDLIQQHITTLVKTETTVLSQNILQRWIDSNYTLTRRELAAEFNCSPSNVTRVITKFRTNLKQLLMGDDILC